MQLPQNVVKDTFLPFHPGAVRYYRESKARCTVDSRDRCLRVLEASMSFRP
jgi:hypothetical protein